MILLFQLIYIWKCQQGCVFMRNATVILGCVVKNMHRFAGNAKMFCTPVF